MTEKKNRNKKQSKAKTSSRVSKGNFGYFRSEKNAADHHCNSFCSSVIYLFYILDLF